MSPLPLPPILLAGEGPAGLPPDLPYDLNPFGSLFAAATWAILLGLNAWCLVRILRRRPPAHDEAAGADEEETPEVCAPAETMPPPAPAPVDARKLAELEQLFGDRSGVVELFEDFFAVLPERLEGIRDGLADGDPARVDHAAHALKGSSASLGAEALRSAALELEQCARRGELDAAGPLLERLEEALRQFEAWVEETGLRGGESGGDPT